MLPSEKQTNQLDLRGYTWELFTSKMLKRQLSVHSTEKKLFQVPKLRLNVVSALKILSSYGFSIKQNTICLHLWPGLKPRHIQEGYHAVDKAACMEAVKSLTKQRAITSSLTDFYSKYILRLLTHVGISVRWFFKR